MRRLICLLFALVLALGCVFSVSAADGNVTYSGDAGEFIFAPGSDYSPTDLFPDFKNVMPGDSLRQAITVKNDASEQVKVKIYIRAMGAHPESEAFLSQLHLRVEKSEDNSMAYMFDAAANERAQLMEWVCLGTLYSGGEVNLNVILDVPAELDNRYQDQAGYLDWQFMIEEFPAEGTDPKPPQTNDRDLTPWIAVLVLAALMLIFLLLWKREKEERE